MIQSDSHKVNELNIFLWAMDFGKRTLKTEENNWNPTF